jgi:stringent starvation protein B
MTPDERPTKRDAFEAFLKEGWVSVHLDARRPGVEVPTALATNPHLVLQYGHNMPLPIPDLMVTDAGIRATLSFARAPFATMVPWSAVYIVACTDGRGVLYYEDVPEEVSLMTAPVDGEAGRATEVDVMDNGVPATAPPVKERFLRSIPASDQDEDDSETAQDNAPARRRRKPQLKVVK